VGNYYEDINKLRQPSINIFHRVYNEYGPYIVYNKDDIYGKVANTIKNIIEQYIPLPGAGYIELSDWVKMSKSCTNIRNDDDKCFLWCHLRHRHPSPYNSPAHYTFVQFLGERSCSTMNLAHQNVANDL
jgi:hypothetical protein